MKRMMKRLAVRANTLSAGDIVGIIEMTFAAIMIVILLIAKNRM